MMRLLLGPNHRVTPVDRSDSGDSEPARSPSNQSFKFIRVRNESNVVLALMGLSAGLFVALLLLLIFAVNNYALARRGKVYVQMQNGTTDVAQEYNDLYRDPKIIQTTAVTWMQLTFEWDNRIPNSTQTDEGVRIDRHRVTTKAYLASYLMEDGFRTAFLQQLAARVMPREVFHGQRRSIMRFYQVSTPRQVEGGTWEVDIVATRIDSTPTREIQEFPLNRTITLKAVPYVSDALGQHEPLVFRQKIYGLMANGLQITKVVPLMENP